MKVISGLLAAMLTFVYTQDWWVLAWFGAIIWFAITAARNVAQAVLSGGGFAGSSLLRWSEHVNMSRVCDSLMYTGFSVPLLELGVRCLLLRDAFGITADTRPLAAFSAMALVNGLYIAGHNYYRGFATAAIVGNSLRSLPAILCAVAYNELLFLLLAGLGVDNPLLWLQPGAAVISKAASDTVACVIEGIADRGNNLRLRQWDYRDKLAQIYDTYAKLEIAHPETDVLRLLARPRDLQHFTQEAGKALRVAAIVNALDLMYIWHYQPQAQRALIRIVRAMTGEERTIIARSLLVLNLTRNISMLFVNGLAGERFSRALSFYLDRHEAFVRAMHDLCIPEQEEESPPPDGESLLPDASEPVDMDEGAVLHGGVDGAE
jgi:hypothetical protein